MPFPAMPTQITCPRCGHRFLTQVRSIVDVGEQPELKEELLRGRINAVRCPQCNGGGLLSTPLVYHDPAKELLVTLVPAELNLSAAEQEQIVGELVNAVMNNVPAEQRKSYFFHPKTVLRYESLFETILEADGISREMLEAQRAILKLIDDLADALEDTEALDKLIEENRDKLDYEFFLVLSDVIESYRAESKGAEDEKNVENVRRLETLRSALLERVSPTTPRASGYDELIDLLLKTEPGSAAWRRTVALNRARLDYGFFQRLTGRIEAAQGVDDEKAKTLTELRSRVLDEIQAQDERVERAQDRAGLLIMRLLEAADLNAALREHQSKIDEVFLHVLSRYIETANEEGDEERASKLTQILNATIDMLEEKLPPQERLINRLLRAEYPEGTNAILEQHRGLLNRELLSLVDDYLKQLQGDQDKTLLEHLRNVRGQIEAKLTILRA